MNKKKRKYTDIIENGKGLVKFYRENPCIAAYELLGVDLAPIQRLMFEDFWFKNYVIGVCGRGSGKTYLLGLTATLSGMLFPGYRTGLISPVFRQSLPIISDTYDTFWTSNGLQTGTQNLYDLVEEGVTKTQSLETQNTILSKWKNPERACRRIKTTKGFELAGTVDHGILVLNSKLDLVFKDLQDINWLDTIVIKKGFKYFGNDNSMPTFDEFETHWRTKDCKIPEEVTPNLAYWAGLLVGDGCVCTSKKGGKYRVDFVNEDQDLLDSFEKHLIEYFVDDPESIDRRNRKNNTWEIQYFRKKLACYLLKCGFTNTTALDKKIPWIIKKASKECIKAFLSGLLDCDGCCYIQQHKHGSEHCEVSLNTSSLQLAKEVQACFLNFGIMSNLGVSNKAAYRCLIGRTKKSKCAEAYKVRITGLPDLNKFRDEIGFRCKRKASKLNIYLGSVGGKISCADRIPNTSSAIFKLSHSCKERIVRGHEDVAILGRIINNANNNNGVTRARIKQVLSLAKKHNILTEDYYKLKKIIDLDLSFVKMVESDYFFAPTIDVEVENESCYWSNGMISHNSKLIFAEVEKLYAQSPILREACEQKPTRSPDACYLKFKSVGGKTPSYIEALPLGSDGGKIRGSRFYLIVIDELAQVPDKIINSVLMPMGATSLAPMERVRRTEQKNRLIKLGLATEDDFEEETVNKMIMTSSGYYKFNHMWKRMKDHWRQMNIAEKEGKESQYSVWQIPHWDLPEGFLDQNNVDEARRISSIAEFGMEYEAVMTSDSEGFFKASLLDTCSIDSGFTVETRPDSKSKYILGVDPNQGGRASCGIIVIKIGSVNKIVQVLEVKTQTTQELTKIIQGICEKRNILRVFMDKGGGGKAICDLLEEGYGGKTPLIDRTNDDHRHLEGSHILELVYFNPSWISDANFATKSMLEDKKLLFPEPPTGSTLDSDAKSYDVVERLKSQMLSIVVTQTSTGVLHFDTPVRGQKKDLYSALLLAVYGARIVEKELEGEGEPLLFSAGGLVMQHGIPGASFNSITVQHGSSGNNVASAALLKKKIK